MKIFTRESLTHSIKPIIIVVFACMFVFYWGKYRKVSIDLTMRPTIQVVDDSPTKIDVTLYDKDGNFAASMLKQVSDSTLATQHINLHPGMYTIRGDITMKTGKTHPVEQTFIVPDNDASIEVYLRPVNSSF